MLRMDHFNFNVLDLEKSLKFYEEALGFTPKRDTYFVTACTEEIGGEGGEAIAKALKERKTEYSIKKLS